jgi:tetratricopeptide (TPR) repeat protein
MTKQSFLKWLFLSLTLFGLFTVLVQTMAADFFSTLQTLQQQGDINSPVPWLEPEVQSSPLFDLREGIPDAITIYEGTILPMAKRWWGAEHYRIARGLNFLAQLYGIIGDYENAERVFLEAVRIMAKRYPRHYDTAAIYNNFGMLYNRIGDYPKAKRYYEKAVTLAKSLKKLGPNHPYTFGGLINLAGIHIALGDYAEAEQYYQQALKVVNSLKDAEETPFEQMRNRWLGEFEGHRQIYLHQNMAQFYAGILGDYDPAERHYQTALTLLNQAMSSPHPIKGAIHQGLGLVYQKQGNYQLAKQESSKALKIYQQLPDWRHSSFSLAALLQLAYIQNLLGNQTDAENSLKRAVNLSEKIPEPDATRTHILGVSHHHLAMFYHWTGELEKAAASFQKALKIFEQRFGVDYPMTVLAMQHFAALKYSF